MLQTGSRCRRSAPRFERYVHTKGEHRVIYLAKFDEGIYVLHAFEKKTRKTRREDVDLARKRLGDVLWDRGRRKTGPGKG